MQSTRSVMGRGTISTAHGQSRILKRLPDIISYIQKAVKAGTYRTNEEIEQMNQKLLKDPTDLKRLRWNVQRGSKIQDYPLEYEIMSLNPPAPFKPFMPLKQQRKILNKHIRTKRPTDALARKYLGRLHHHDDAEAGGAPLTADEYYRRLLGVNHVPKVDSAMGNKSAALNKAYAFAVKQHELMRTQNLSEADALEQVEKLLAEEDKSERHLSRAVAEDLQAKRASSTETEDAAAQAKEMFPLGKNPSLPKSKDSDDSYLSSLYSDQQMAFEGMISWTQRLQAVPYRQWTVGASTTLDHWIAKRVLGMSEETWLALLEGDDPSLTSRGRDIVMARHALFPETILDKDGSLDQQEQEMAALEGAEDEDDDIDKLLATLGGYDEDDEETDASEKKFDWKSHDDDHARDEKVMQLTEELQEWRARQVETPYEKWSDEQQGIFKTWLEGYVTALTPTGSLNRVDMDATRNALLASPPQSQEESNQFWDSIRDETAAEIFLQRLLDSGPPEDATSSQKIFWEMPYEDQLAKLVNLGAIREIVDEYTKDSDRAKFLSRYGDYLLEGVTLDHLVPDPKGPISGKEIGDRLAKHFKVKPTDRFRLEKIPYGTDEFGSEKSQRARDLFRAWNKFKAGRAHYEEKMFQRGLLGLRYDEEEK